MVEKLSDRLRAMKSGETITFPIGKYTSVLATISRLKDAAFPKKIKYTTSRKKSSEGVFEVTYTEEES